jgi:hypothetical protein
VPKYNSLAETAELSSRACIGANGTYDAPCSIERMRKSTFHAALVESSRSQADQGGSETGSAGGTDNGPQRSRLCRRAACRAASLDHLLKIVALVAGPRSRRTPPQHPPSKIRDGRGHRLGAVGPVGTALPARGGTSLAAAWSNGPCHCPRLMNWRMVSHGRTLPSATHS